ncbi:hypothetical protein Prede_2579 [Prevotella dentalis DSM 3688]|uniref:DUF6046 domain-containing protein n=2 Tax=Prevotella dentalis TaxID=52227 RepID=F9D780_PREDD|nr:DUF6046 domain-containing protein [Prevotella dentalis]AGB29755.1 hypothetical protein Prede_2510 [Prevotella dentalis DSM 3688]AGB29814.1 hypothetical protein Prede_2579 [Prevotella dentalis DSM 3688]EGQ11446.1 hypothetical protein HMPREF9136_2708 [Prevotella dentalis DSM 3688]
MLPISFKFVAAGTAIQAKGPLYKFHPARTGQAPDWSNRGSRISPNDVATPITDKSYWEGRYALCELTFEKEDGERLVMNDAIVAISQQKEIVMTALVGMDGTVKEYINQGDYQVNILVGILATENGTITDRYPEDGIRQLHVFMEEKHAIKVYSTFFDLFNIDRIVIKGFDVAQATESNYQQISLSAVSDSDYNIFSSEY